MQVRGVIAATIVLGLLLVPATSSVAKDKPGPPGPPGQDALVATVDSEVDAGADSGPAPKQVASAERAELLVAAAGCWWARVRRYATNIFGSTLWAYFQRIDWCSNGSSITSHSRTRWGETYWPGWSWKGNIGSTQGGGNGSTYYRSWTQGHFCLISYFSCVQDRYPWIDMTVNRSGGWSWSAGG